MLYFITSVTILIVPVLSGYSGDSCYVSDNPGKCTPLSQCQPLLDEIRAAGNPMPIHMNKRLQGLGCGFISKEPLVCCSFHNRSETRAPIANTTISSKNDVANQNSTNGDLDDGLQDVTNHPNLKLLPKFCGTAETDKIVGGNRTQLYEMPWMVILSYDEGGVITPGCGGTLISERYVLTAAHCVRPSGGKVLVGVTLGEHDRRTDPDCEVLKEKTSCASRVVNATIEEVISHPGYKKEKFLSSDDIALIRLARPANFNISTISPICMPATRELQRENLDGKYGTVAGWGITENKVQSQVLLKVSLPVITNEDCQAIYKGKPPVDSRRLCAGNVKDMDACGGDSGGPFMYPGLLGSGGVRMVQRAVVSFGPRSCGNGVLPGVYTRLSHYMKWILDNMRS